MKKEQNPQEPEMVPEPKPAPVKAESKESKKKKIFIITSIVLLIIIVLTLFAFKDKIFSNSSPNNKKNEVINDVKEVTSAYKITDNNLQDFDLKFLQLENSEKNIVYSPLSIKYALEMLGEGASGETKKQIDAILGNYESNNYESSAHMSFANAMFIRNSYKSEVKSTYVKNLKNNYSAEVIYDDFKNPNNINKWISDKTFNLINNLVDNTDDVNYFLVNALAIDLEWKNKIQQTSNDGYDKMYSAVYDHEAFAKYIDLLGIVDVAIKFNNEKVEGSLANATINNYDIIKDKGRDNIKSFISDKYQKWLKTSTCAEYASQNVDEVVEKYLNELSENYHKVYQSTDFRFYKDDNVQVFAKELKKSNGTTLEYVGIMPLQESLSTYVKSINAKQINNLLGNLKEIKTDSFAEGKIYDINLAVPYFNYEYTLNLKDDLEQMGVKDVFDSTKADLSNLSSTKNNYIEKIAHKANIEFSNEGIKAAAATVEGGAGAAGCEFDYHYDVPVETINIIFEKPFMYLIRNVETGEVWFTGNVYSPTKTQADKYYEVVNTKEDCEASSYCHKMIENAFIRDESEEK